MQRWAGVKPSHPHLIRLFSGKEKLGTKRAGGEEVGDSGAT